MSSVPTALTTGLTSTNILMDPLVWGVLAFAAIGAVAIFRSYQQLRRFEGVLELPAAEADTLVWLNQRVPETALGSLSERFPLGGMDRPNREHLLDEIDHDLAGNDNIVRFFVSSLTIVGLMLTFWGMLETLGQAADLIRQLQGQSGVDVQAAFNRLIVGLQGVLAGMTAAFARTVAALIASLLLGLWFSLLTRQRAPLFLELTALVDTRVMPLYYRVQHDARLPELVQSIAASVHQGLNELRTTQQSGNEAAKTLANATSSGFEILQSSLVEIQKAVEQQTAKSLASAAELQVSLSHRTEAEKRLQNEMATTTVELGRTLESLKVLLERNADMSSEVVQALMAVDPRGRQLTHFEDLKNLFAGVHVVVQKQAEGLTEQSKQLEAAQSISLQLQSEQTAMLTRVATRLETPEMLPVLQQLASSTQSHQRASLELLEKIASQGAQAQVESALPDDATELLKEQVRFLTRIAARLERPWWERALMAWKQGSMKSWQQTSIEKTSQSNKVTRPVSEAAEQETHSA